MSEHLPTTNHEQEPVPLMMPERRIADAEHSEKLREGEKDPVKALMEAHKDVHEALPTETQPNPLERLKTEEKAAQPAPPIHHSPELKKVNVDRMIGRIQRQLPTADRVLSKVIHQPVIRAVSETASKTVSRPSGLLGGGLVALAGTSGYLYLARHIGFTYNYGVFLVLFVGGFIVGIALELMVHMMTASRRSSD